MKCEQCGEPIGHNIVTVAGENFCSNECAENWMRQEKNTSVSDFQRRDEE